MRSDGRSFLLCYNVCLTFCGINQKNKHFVNSFQTGGSMFLRIQVAHNWQTKKKIKYNKDTCGNSMNEKYFTMNETFNWLLCTTNNGRVILKPFQVSSFKRVLVATFCMIVFILRFLFLLSLFRNTILIGFISFFSLFVKI